MPGWSADNFSGEWRQLRLYGVLQWLQKNPQIDPDVLILPGESPEKLRQRRESVERFALAASEFILNKRKQHPLVNAIGLDDPVVRAELERSQKPQTVEPGPFSFESMYPSQSSSEPRTFTDDFRTGNKFQDAQHAPKPQKPFAPEPGKDRNR